MAKASKPKDDSVTLIIPQQAQTANAQTFDMIVQTELKKYDAVIPAVSKLKKEYMPLVIKDATDLDGYKAVSDALKFMVKKRGEIEAKRKELKEDSLKFGKAVDARAKEIQEMIAPIEQHLRTEKDRVDAEIEEQERQKEEARQAAILARHNTLVGLRMNLIGDTYTWEGGLTNERNTLHRMNIELLDEEEWNFHVAEQKKLYENEEKKVQAELEAEKARQADFEKQQQQLKQQQEEHAAKLKEEEEVRQAREAQIQAKLLAMQEKVYAIRKKELEAEGMVLARPMFSSEDWFVYEETQILSKSTVFQSEDEDYERLANLAKEKISGINARKAEREAEVQRHKEAFQAELEEQAKLKAEKQEQQRIADEQKKAEQQAEQQRQFEAKQASEKAEAEAKEAARLAKMGDREKLGLYVGQLLAVQLPELKSEDYNKTLATLTDYIKKIKAYCDGTATTTG
jgi:colicin import membrane protein